MNTEKKPILAVMVGISGSGKSTYGSGLKTSLKLENGLETRMVSTDDIRGELTNDPSDQSRNAEVFSIARRRVQSGLEDGINMIIDATSVNPKDRKLWIEIGRNAGATIRAYFINTPLSVAKKRNISRSRVVPDFVIDRQHSRLIPPTKGEGFESVVTVS